MASRTLGHLHISLERDGMPLSEPVLVQVDNFRIARLIRLRCAESRVHFDFGEQRATLRCRIIWAWTGCNRGLLRLLLPFF
jgi:hypothetical protein